MTPNVITTEAIYDNGVLRPVGPLPLAPKQRVNLVIHPAATKSWPDNVAEIYDEINAEEKRLANSIWPVVEETWPIDED
jgi:predicted DNA-binding antitoxin AbrB/MazE fold protein